MTTRIKAPSSLITSREQMEKLVGEIAMLTAAEQALTAELNGEITKLKTKYLPGLKEIAEAISVKTALARDWAQANPTEFGAARSINMTHGVIGFRLGNRTVALLNRKWTWAKVVAALLDLKWTAYIRENPEVNKQAILDSEETAENLQTIGVKIVREESFYIEPALAKTETRIQEAA